MKHWLIAEKMTRSLTALSHAVTPVKDTHLHPAGSSKPQTVVIIYPMEWFPDYFSFSFVGGEDKSVEGAMQIVGGRGKKASVTGLAKK